MKPGRRSAGSRRDSRWLPQEPPPHHHYHARLCGGGGGTSPEVRNRESAAAFHPRPNMNRRRRTQCDSFSGSFILPRSPFLPPPPPSCPSCPPSLRLPLEERAVRGEGRQKMIMQQAAVLHPDTHGYSAPSPGLRRPRNAASAHGPTCTPAAARRAGDRYTVTPKQTQEKRKGMRPGLTLHYGARLPLSLSSLSPRSLALFLSLSCQPALRWLDPSCPPRPDPPPRAASNQARPF